MGDRSAVVSSFTIVKGAFSAETRKILAEWDDAKSKRENLDRLREQSLFGTRAATWNRDVAKVLNRRFDPASRDRGLVYVARSGCDAATWKSILLWHMTRDEFLLRDFLIEFLFPRYTSGVHLIQNEPVVDYLSTIAARGALSEHEWSDATTRRVAAGLLNIATELGFLRGRRKKEITAYRLTDDAFLYVLHALKHANDVRTALDSPEWRMYMMAPVDVEREIFRLHQLHRLQYHVAGSLAQLDLPSTDEVEFAERMIA